MHIAKSRLLDANDFKSALNRSAEPIAVFREQLRRGRDTLEQCHLDGALAQEVVYHHAWLVDQFVCAAWQYCAGNTDPDTGIALVAVGGYGRGELHPHSDVDLMLLLRARAAPELREFAERFLRFLWDIGLDVGHSVRTVADSTREAKRDITIATNIMESRHLAGDKTLTEAMQVRTAAPRVWPARRRTGAALTAREPLSESGATTKDYRECRWIDHECQRPGRYHVPRDRVLNSPAYSALTTANSRHHQ